MTGPGRTQTSPGRPAPTPQPDPETEELTLVNRRPPPGAPTGSIGVAPVHLPPPAPLTAPGELREDPLSGRVAAIASGRAARPEAFLRDVGPPRGTLGCPFCPGNEHMTPPEVWADRDPGSHANGPGWRVRVVPNKFPAFAGPPGPTNPDGGLYRSAPSAGAHEVVIHSTDHNATLADLPDKDVALVFGAYRQRLLAHRDEPLGSIVVIVNQGRTAGASLEHPHSQVIATVERPDLVRAELDRLGGADCAACAVVGRERGGGRLIEERDELLTICPWASAAPYEALLLPSSHQPRFEQRDESGDHALAGALGRLLRRFSAVVGSSAPYNLVMHSAPPGTDGFHWHLHLIPRLTTYGGFELATGIIINVVDPDQAARSLRGAAAGDGISGS
jgi:UDPglucose--hexose-1-phosphate uridylyltransferase